MIYKTLVRVAFLLGVANLIIFFLYAFPDFFTNIQNAKENVLPIPLSENREYKISVTHNGKPILDDQAGEYKGIRYKLVVYNDSTVPYCDDEFVKTSSIKSSDYTFNSTHKSTHKIEGKNLKSYEKEGYAFNIFAQSDDDSTFLFSTRIRFKNEFNSSFTYTNLPKLTQNFSISFDIPVFKKNSVLRTINQTTLSIHLEMKDAWIKSNTFYCRLDRNYDPTTDENLPNCPAYFNSAENQCARRFNMDCKPDVIWYMIPTVRDDNGIDCNFDLKQLTSSKVYRLRIITYEKIDDNLEKFVYINIYKYLTIP